MLAQRIDITHCFTCVFSKTRNKTVVNTDIWKDKRVFYSRNLNKKNLYKITIHTALLLLTVNYIL